MRFSIRSLLAIMLLFAISFPLVIGLRQLQRDDAFRSQLVNEILVQRQRLALDDPQTQRIRKHQRDQYASMRRLRDKAEQHFEMIQAKYGGLEPRGPEVLSLRTIPQLSVDDTRPPVVFRIAVPAEREVWLKYALVPGSGGSQRSKKLDKMDEPLAETGFEHSGLYQRRLEPGERVLQVHAGTVIGNELPILIRLDDQVLLETRFRGDGVPSTGSFHISGRKQIDFDLKRNLPWLLNVQIRVEQEDGRRVDVPQSAASG